VLLPLVAVHLWRRRGGDTAVTVVAAFLIAAAACFLPFAILAPGGLHAMFSDQLGRPLQVESLGAGALMAAEHLGLRPLTTVNSHGAQALSGRGAGLAADLATVLEIVAVVAVWWLYAVRRRTDGEGLLLAAAAAVTALVAFDKVLSPQYLIWLVPFVFLVRGGRGVYVGGLVPLALLVARARPRRTVVVVSAGSRPRARRRRGRAAPGAQPRTRFRRRKSRFAGRSASRRMR
jgi:hypothetical protein